MRALRGLLFDLDGVLVDSYQVWFHVQNALARELGQPAISPERFRERWGQSVEDDIRHFYPGSTVEQVERYYDEHFADHLEHLQVIPGGTALFAQLRERGYPAGVITNTPAPLARRLLAIAGIEPDAVVGGTDVPAAKPAPDMVLRGAELLGLPVSEVAVVGDSRYDRDAARAAGAAFIGFGGIEGDVAVTRLDQIPGLLEG